jgi:hypothetical protein
MTLSRRFPHAVATIAAALLLLAAASAPASAAEPTWLSPQTLSESGPDVYGPAVISAPDGSVTMLWAEVDGGDARLMARTRLASAKSWSDAVQVSPVGEPLAGFVAATDDDSNVTIGWLDNPGGQPTKFDSTTRLAGSTTWTDSVAVTDPSENFGEGVITRGPHGTVVGAYPSYTGTNRLRIYTRAPNSNDWGPSTDIAADPSSGWGQMDMAFNDSGDGVFAWAVWDGSTNHIRASRYSADTGTWSDPAEVIQLDSNPWNVKVAIAPGGDAAVVWADGDGDHSTRAATMSAGSGDWSPPAQLSSGSDGTVTPQVAVDGSGNFTAVWMRFPTTPWAVLSSTRDAGTGVWSAPATVSDGEFGGAPMLAANRNGDMVISFLTSATGPSDPHTAAAYRANGAGD